MALCAWRLAPTIVGAALMIASVDTLLACRHPSRAESRESWADRLRELRGKSKEHVLQELGEPHTREESGPLEVWGYAYSWSERHGTLFRGSSGGELITSHQDVIRLYFAEGILRDWVTGHQ